ncbi:MAG: glycosyltransferase family 4 protein [Steroidobacteraceae bacterium]
MKDAAKRFLVGLADMRILFLSDNFRPESNAPAARLYEHAVRWVRAGHEVTIITCAPNFPEGKLFPGYRNRWRDIEWMDDIRVVRVKSFITANEGFLLRTLDYVSFMLTSFIAGLFERRPDVVVATSPQFFCAAGGWALSAVRRLPFVFELRDLWPASIEAVGAMRSRGVLRCLEKVELFLYRRSNAVIAVTESFRADLVRRGIPAEKIHVVMNGVDMELFSPREVDPEYAAIYDTAGKFVVGYLGTHGLAHNLPKVLEAVELLRARTDIVFIFAGSGAGRRHVEEIVADRSLTNVRLIPRQPKDVMPRLWSLCDLTLVPLRDSPVFSTVIPSKIFESMGMGVPILISVPAGEAVDIVLGAQAGISVPPDDAEAIAEAIIRLADSSHTLARMKASAMAAAGRYSRASQARKMLSILEEHARQ